MVIYRKFTDEEFLELYNYGLGDLKISIKLDVAQNAVWSRRTKLGLIANYLRKDGEPNLTKNTLLDRYKESNKRKSDRRRWKMENRPGFKKEYMEKCYKWQKENPEKWEIIKKKGKITFNLKNPNYYFNYHRNLNNKCSKCDKIIDNRSIYCKSCSNRERYKDKHGSKTQT